MVTYLHRLLTIKSNDCIFMWIVRDLVTNKKRCIFTATMLMATKRMMMTYFESLLPIKSHEHVVKGFCKITWQTKIIGHTLTHCLWLSIWAGWGYTFSFHKVTRFFDYVVLQGHVNYFSSKTWQSNELL